MGKVEKVCFKEKKHIELNKLNYVVLPAELSSPLTHSLTLQLYNVQDLLGHICSYTCLSKKIYRLNSKAGNSLVKL